MKIIPAWSKTYFIAITLILSGLSVFLHVWKIGEIPPGFYWDECSVSYNAYCLAETGKDEQGRPFPLFCSAFSYYADPVAVYSLVPVVKIFGLSKTSSRNVSAFYILFASVLLFFLSRNLVRNKWIALCTAFLFSIMPWTFPASRTIIGGYAPMLLWIIAGIYFLLRSVGGNNWKYAVLAGFSWSMVMYSYSCGRPFSAIAMIVFVLAFNHLLVKRIRTFAVFIISYFCSSIPLIVAVIHNPGVIMNRFYDLGISGGGVPFHEVITGVLVRYVEYFSPSFLFIQGDLILRHGTGNSGVLYVFMIPLVLAGLYVMIKYFRNNPSYRFLFLLLLCYPVAGIFTNAHNHAPRTMDGAPLWSLVVCVGMMYAWRKRKKCLTVIIALTLLAGYEISTYFNYYFGEYSVESRRDFDASINEMLEYVFNAADRDTETVYFSKEVLASTGDDFKPIWYVSILFWGKIDPSTYLKAGRIPEDIAMIFNGEIKKPGILVRLDYFPVVDRTAGTLAWEQNKELLPAGNNLIRKMRTYSGANFEIYRVSPPGKTE